MTQHETSLLQLIHDKVEKIEKILTGNGEPEKGMIIRLDRLEVKAKRASWLFATIFGAVVVAAAEAVFKLL